MTFTFLGTGSAFSKKYGNNSCLVTVKQGDVSKNLLIDCGRTAPDDLHNSGYKWEDIDAIFITHLHGDHVYGLEEAGFVGRYALKRKPHIIFPDRKVKNDLWEKVLKGTMADGDLDRKMVFEDYFTYEVVPTPEEYFEFNGLMVSVYQTQHVKNKKSYGLIFGEYEYVVYTSDSLFDKGFISAILDAGAKAVFHDCSFANYKGKVHASLDELETLTEDERNKVYLMHYTDDIYDHYHRIKDDGFNIAIKYDSYSFKV